MAEIDNAGWHEQLTQSICRQRPHLDWREVSCYRYIEQCDPAKIAWEILRRSDAYRHDFLEFYNSVNARNAMLPIICEKYGLSLTTGPLHYMSTMTPLFAVLDVPLNVDRISTYDGSQFYEEPAINGKPEERYMDFRVYIDGPLERQLNQIEKLIMQRKGIRSSYIRAENEGLGRWRRDKKRGRKEGAIQVDAIITYARLLDATLDGWKQSDIARVLYPEDSRYGLGLVCKQLKCARELASGGYLKIAERVLEN